MTREEAYRVKEGEHVSAGHVGDAPILTTIPRFPELDEYGLRGRGGAIADRPKGKAIKGLACA